MVELIIACIVVGALLYLLSILPIDATMKSVAQIIIIVVFAIYAIRFLAPMAGLD